MNKRGLIRKTLIVVGLTWLWLNFFFSDSRFISNPAQRRAGQIAVLVIAVWGVITLLADRAGRGG